MRLLKVLCVLAVAISLTGFVYAETQSVKISGDMTVRSFLRDDYDLDHNNTEGRSVRLGIHDDWQTYFTTATEVQIDADLTDNVSAVIRLFNQRDWNVTGSDIIVSDGESLSTLFTGTGGYTANDNEFDVGVDLAYIELKEFLYSPLTLKIGRQDIWFGKGFIVGANLRDPQGTINADEYTVMSSFDAIRATLDYDPWTIDAIAAKIWENSIQSSDDVDLIGINVGYIFDVFNAESEAYWFSKKDDSIKSWNVKNSNDVHTIGLRGSMDPIEDWTIAAETALQFGEYLGSRTQLEKRERSAWAVDASMECRYFQEMFEWKPLVGVEYIYYSGHKNIAGETKSSTGTYTGWDPMYRGKFDSAIREFAGVFHTSVQDENNARRDMNPVYPDASVSNQHQVIFVGSLEPTDSLTIDGRYLLYWQQYATYHIGGDNEGAASENVRIKDDKFLGSEIDIEVTWDYTEDVSFGFLAAWFFPGSHYADMSDDVATDIVGSVKLSF